ncbi:hypothetical protein AB0B01_02500 [Streptomyces sp. NPDC044571]|uniref:hypothetical protein n=1 Tax=Streptomyces sp. NPDC044571 TaxID=3155371 RepID=UPI0033E57F68
MSARRPLLTALGATTLLAALWFVPSANATAPGAAGPASGAPEPATAPAPAPGTVTAIARTDAQADPQAGPGSGRGAAPQTAGQASLALADTGGIDTTPYLLGGTLCLGVGAGFVTFSVRRSRAV